MYTLESMYIPDPENGIIEDIQESFKSTLDGMYSTVNLARASMREAMSKQTFDSVYDEDVEVKGDASWDQFYSGPVAEMDAAIEALLRGDESAESKFEFPWEEVWKDGGVEIRIGGLFRVPLEDEEEVGEEGRVVLEGKRRPYVWSQFDEGHVNVFVIRPLIVSPKPSHPMGNLARSGELGVVPLVAEFVNDYLGTAGKTVYTLESMYVPYLELFQESLDFPWWELLPDSFKSTLIDTFSTVNLARAAMREAMSKKAFDSVYNDNAVKEKGDASWDQFYWGPVSEMDAAIEALLRGDEGAESKFSFPWFECWKKDCVEIRIGGLSREPLGDEDEEEKGEREEKGEGERTYFWSQFDAGDGNFFVIRQRIVV